MLTFIFISVWEIVESGKDLALLLKEVELVE